MTTALFQASGDALSDSHPPETYPAAKVHIGLIASGDRFVSNAIESNDSYEALQVDGHEMLAVEMGAAVAQVCHDYGVPFAAERASSDRADDSAHGDFPSFIDQAASRYAQVTVEKFLTAL